MVSQDRGGAARDEILKAATWLFANRGFHETSMTEVARSARVSKGLIFYHFKTKEELFFAVLNRLLEPYIIDFAEEASSLDEKSQILKLIESYLLFVRDNASSVRLFIAQVLHDQDSSDSLTGQVLRLYDGYRTLLADLIARAQEKGLCTREFPPQAAVSFLLSMLSGVLIGFLLGNQGVDHEGAMAMLQQWLFPNDRSGAAPSSDTQ